MLNRECSNCVRLNKSLIQFLFQSGDRRHKTLVAPFQLSLFFTILIWIRTWTSLMETSSGRLGWCTNSSFKILRKSTWPINNWQEISIRLLLPISRYMTELKSRSSKLRSCMRTPTERISMAIDCHATATTTRSSRTISLKQAMASATKLHNLTRETWAKSHQSSTTRMLNQRITHQATNQSSKSRRTQQRRTGSTRTKGQPDLNQVCLRPIRATMWRTRLLAHLNTTTHGHNFKNEKVGYFANIY